MKDFSLLKRLNKTKTEKTSPLAEGISYQKYEVEVDSKVQLVNIPLRESENFEKAITEHKKPLTRKSLKILLREFRGVREE